MAVQGNSDRPGRRGYTVQRRLRLLPPRRCRRGLRTAGENAAECEWLAQVVDPIRLGSRRAEEAASLPEATGAHRAGVSRLCCECAVARTKARTCCSMP